MNNSNRLAIIDEKFFRAAKVLGGRIILTRMVVYRQYFDIAFDAYFEAEHIASIVPCLVGQVQVTGCSQTPATLMGSIKPDFSSFGWRIEGLLSQPDVEPNGSLLIVLTDGRSEVLEIEKLFDSYPDQYNLAIGESSQLLQDGTPKKLLELGGRGATSAAFRALLPPNIEYESFDIKAGDGVDYVGDAHELSSIVGNEKYDIIYSASVFEHLAQPWVVAVEANKVLKLGGFIFTDAPNAWPLHETPWDFWRFTEFGWASLFNPGTGFEIACVDSYDESAILPLVMGPIYVCDPMSYNDA